MTLKPSQRNVVLSLKDAVIEKPQLAQQEKEVAQAFLKYGSHK